jgi:hypothetical protein
MASWQPTAYKQYQWIVADPHLLGGKLAIRGTRLAASLILECLASNLVRTACHCIRQRNKNPHFQSGRSFRYPQSGRSLR